MRATLRSSSSTAAVAALVAQERSQKLARAVEMLTARAGVYARVADGHTRVVALDDLVDSTWKGPPPVETDFRSRLIAAEQLASGHPLETFPPPPPS